MTLYPLRMNQTFVIITGDQTKIRFHLYTQEAPATCAAFMNCLPFSSLFFHARVSGEEIWMDQAPELDVPQENASVFTVPGEVVLGPLKPTRAKTSKCMGIYYGEGKGLDACNIFAKVYEEDMELLKKLGDSVWRKGAQKLSFEVV